MHRLGHIHHISSTIINQQAIELIQHHIAFSQFNLTQAIIFKRWHSRLSYDHIMDSVII